MTPDTPCTSKWRKQTLIGKRFGRLTVVSQASPRGDTGRQERYWLCKCDCGKTKTTITRMLNGGLVSSCGCLREEKAFPDLVGQHFGALEVLAPGGKGGGRTFWLCLCRLCGKTNTKYHTTILRLGRLKSCGCQARAKGVLRGRTLPSGHAMRNTVLKMYKNNAKRQNKPWDLTKEEAFELFAGHCHYCGEPPSRTVEKQGKNGAFTYNGIDRKDNELGYTVENCVSACTDCNLMKSSQGYESFIARIEKIYHNAIRSKPISIA